jgi:uncharacterized protein (TIGR02271 family)
MSMAYESEYSAGGQRRTITAFFDSRSDADDAVERLAAAGISRAHINVVAGASEGAATRQNEEGGFWAALADFFMPDEDRYSYAEGLRRGGTLVTVQADTGQYETALDILDDEGSVDFNEREESWRSEGWRGYEGRSEVNATGSWRSSEQPRAPGASTSTGGQQMQEMYRDDSSREGVIPVVEENLRIGKRDVSHGRVKVRSYVVEEPVSETVDLHDERVDIERRPADRAATSADGLFEDRTIEMEERAEEAVVAKDARVTEEIALRKQAKDRTETISDTVRHTEVEIDDERDESGAFRRDR